MQQVRRKSLLILALATLALSLLAAISLTAITAAQAKEIEVIDNGGATVVKAVEKVETVTVEQDSFVLEEPTRPGYRFEGWYTDSDCTNRVTEIERTEGQTIYVKWVEKTIAETYNAQSNTFEIYTLSHLQGIWSLASFNSIYNDYTIDSNISLCTDIDNVDSAGNVIEWPTIPAIFLGTFEGNGHVIKNIKITLKEGGKYGLFKAVAQTGIITNLKFEKVNITTYKKDNSSTTYVGIIAGTSKGTISNCSITSGNISVKTYKSSVGGFVGFCETGTVKNCSTSNSVTIFGNGNVGGIVGYATYGASVLNCSNDATISYSFDTENGCAAGIVGKLSLNAKILYCSNMGYIKYTGLLKLSHDISPCMAQIVGWNLSGEQDHNEIEKNLDGTIVNKCDFGWLKNYQTSYCSKDKCGRTGT